MFNSLKGVISGKTSDSLYLDTGSIEWVLEASAGTLSKLPAPGREARVYTYLHHKEDSMQLFGFYSLKERELFLNLITVSGVGPKGARKILSGVTVESFLKALETEDVKALSRLPGLGTKTAQKIILQLKGKLITPDDDVSASSGLSELAESLVAMGFDKRKTLKILKDLEQDSALSALPEHKKEQETLRRAIVELSSQ